MQLVIAIFAASIIYFVMSEDYLEQISSKYAIGRDIHVGDTIIGIKGRVGFEAAAAKIIIKSHELLEKHTMSKWQIFQKESIKTLGTL